MPQTATAQNPRRASGWSPERRAKQSAMMRARKIWLKSTGPRTKAGKARSSRNAAKPWLRSHPDRIMGKALRAHGRYLTEINRFIAMKKIPVKNELLKRMLHNHRRTLLRHGKKILRELAFALAYAKLCKNLDFLHRLPVKVNANDTV